jgi:N-succinyldiaminopimelate aminotransferase
MMVITSRIALPGLHVATQCPSIENQTILPARRFAGTPSQDVFTPVLPKLGQFTVFPPSMIHEITRLVHQHHALNLAQGTPAMEQDKSLREVVAQAALAGKDKYTPAQGLDFCLTAIADNRNKELNPAVPYKASDVLFTAGGTEAFSTLMHVLLQPNDDIITSDPYYGLYAGAIQSAMGGDPQRLKEHLKTFPMKQVPVGNTGKQEYQFDLDAFEKSLTDQTKVVLLITPHNPTGAVLSKTDFERIAHIIDAWEIKHPGRTISVVSDETYEHILYDNQAHVSAASVPNILKRLFLINSLSKTFNTTGERIAHLLIPPSPPNAPAEVETAKKHLMESLRDHKNASSMCGFEGFQDLVKAAYGQLAGPKYYQELHDHYDKKRQLMLTLLDQSPFNHYYVPKAGYFIMVDITNILDHLKPDVKQKYQVADAESFVRNLLIPEIKVGVVPGSGLYHHPEVGKNMIRISFCPDQKTIEDAFVHLAKLNGFMQ